MTELQRYLAEEIAEDHADGLVSRREALRRLGLLGVSGAAAASLLAAIVADEARATMRTALGGAAADESRGGELGDGGAADAGDHVRRAGRPEADGCVVAALRPRGGVLVVHENRGLNDSIRAVAGRLAASGYSALAIDLLSEEGGTGSFADEFEAMAALGAAPPSRFVADMKAGVTELRRRLPGKKVAATGFCFGGGMVWLLLASKESRLAAAVPFYGPFPGGREPRGHEGGGPRDLCGARLAGQRHAARGARGAPQGRPPARGRDLPGRRPRVLQPDRVTVRPGCGSRRVPAPAGLARNVRRGLSPRPVPD